MLPVRFTQPMEQVGGPARIRIASVDDRGACSGHGRGLEHRLEGTDIDNRLLAKHAEAEYPDIVAAHPVERLPPHRRVVTRADAAGGQLGMGERGTPGIVARTWSPNPPSTRRSTPVT